MKTHQGSCHCGAVTFTVNADIEKAMECNCSYCSRKGFLLHFIPREQFTLISGEENLTKYHFNRHHIDHLFCKTCGVQAFAYGKKPDGTEIVALNVRSIPDVDVAALTIEQIDGKSF